MKLIIDVKVQDVDRAVMFYTDMLGFQCRRKEEEWAAIPVGDAEIHLYRDGGVSSGVEFYVDDIDVEVKKLKERGVVFKTGGEKPHAKQVDENMITEFPWGRTAFFNDSEGNELAIVKDN